MALYEGKAGSTLLEAMSEAVAQGVWVFVFVDALIRFIL